MHYALVVASRVVTGAVAALAFYLAFFLYEDEEGVWQNRIDDLWRAVNKRAKGTEGVTVALFNKIGQILNGGFTQIFGKKLLSFRSFAISINLSLAGGGTLALLLSYWSLKTGLPPSPPQGIGALLTVTVMFFLLTALPVIFGDRKWVAICSVAPISFVLITAVYMFHQLIFNPGYQSQPLLLLLSFMSDYAAIIVLRKLFVSISKTRSTIRLVSTILALVLFSLLIWIFPSAGLGWLGKNYAISLRIQVLAIELVFFNFTTALLCLIPAVMLIFLLLHKFMWPVLSRLISPLHRFKIVTNRKALVSVGSLCLTFALNIAQVGIKEILKLF